MVEQNTHPRIYGPARGLFEFEQFKEFANSLPKVTKIYPRSCDLRNPKRLQFYSVFPTNALTYCDAFLANGQSIARITYIRRNDDTSVIDTIVKEAIDRGHKIHKIVGEHSYVFDYEQDYWKGILYFFRNFSKNLINKP